MNTRNPFHLAALAAAILSPSPTRPAAPPCHGLEAVTAVAQEAMAQLAGIPGLSVRVDQHGDNVYLRSFGSYTLQQNVPLYSATKPLSTAVVLALVDQQVLRLDDPLSVYLPEYGVPPLDSITLRMCLSHTSGMPYSSTWISNTSTTLREAARNIAQLPLQFAPGTQFAYGNVAMQSVGAACEVVTGQSWSQLFAQLVAGPLGLTNTDYTANGVTANPRIAGGARSDLRDYTRFLDMLRGGGVSGGVRVLSQRAVDAMLTDHTSYLPTFFTPNPHGAPYGLGLWLDQIDADGRTTHASSPGFRGFTGWLDRARDVTGVVLANHNGTALFPYFERCVAAVDASLLPAGVACVGTGSPACTDDTWLNGTTWARAGLADFGFRVDAAPPSAVGVLLIDAVPLGSPLPLWDLTLWIGPTAGAVGLVADAKGHAELATPLTAIAAGRSVALQSLWIEPVGCGQIGLRASHALTLTTQP